MPCLLYVQADSLVSLELESRSILIGTHCTFLSGIRVLSSQLHFPVSSGVCSRDLHFAILQFNSYLFLSKLCKVIGLKCHSTLIARQQGFSELVFTGFMYVVHCSSFSYSQLSILFIINLEKASKIITR